MKIKTPKNAPVSIEIEKKIARLEAFTTFNPRPVIEIDFKGNVLEQNKSAKKLFPDLYKKGPNHIYLSDLDNIIKSLKKEKEPFRREIKIGLKWYKQVFYLIPQFNMIHIYASDATERKETEKKLKESQRRYHALFEKMNYGYILQDIIFDANKKPIDYRFVDANPAFEKLVNVKKSDILGKTANQISKNPQTKEGARNRKKYNGVALTGKPAYFENYNEDSRKYFQMYAYKPNEHQVALIVSDITRRKTIDEERDNFISIMSHELRNPLTPILANAQFIKSLLQKQKNVDPAIRESVNIIEKEAKMMAELLGDILDVSRLSRKKIAIQKSVINICDVVKNSIKTSMPFITTKKQSLSVSFAQNPMYMNADPVRIEQIMVNVINNASKYTKRKGRISINCAIKNKKIEIRVKDNGIGISPERIKHIFKLFNDEGQPFMGIGGMGIGLNIVKNLVSMHKGAISVNSEGKNKGSEFIITFPANKIIIKPIKKEVLPDQNHIRKNKKKTSKILIVDDNKDILNIMSKILRAKGHITKTTHNGRSAIKMYKSFQPDTMLIDIGLPDIDGYKVAKILREQHPAKNQKIKLIALTGYGQKKDKDLAKQAGFDYHLTKPIDTNYLMKLL